MSTISAHTTRVSASVRREVLMSELNRLDDRDTLKSAVCELTAIIQKTEAQDVSSLVSFLCRIERHQKNYAKKECLRLLVSLASSECPSRDVFLSPAVVSKTTKFLVQTFNDRDAGVRETAAQTFSTIVQEWSFFHKQLLSGEPSNIFVKRIFMALDDSRRETQIAASHTLGDMSVWMDSLNKELIKECLRLLKNPHFHAKANLLKALATVDPDTQEPRGIVKASVASFRPLVFHFIGQDETTHRTGHGLLHLLFNPDWCIRKAAVESLHCLTLLYGPSLIQPKKKLAQKINIRLQRKRFDRVKFVRDAVQQTLELYESTSESNREGNHVDLVESEAEEPSTQQPKPTLCLSVPDESTIADMDGMSCIEDLSNAKQCPDGDMSEKESDRLGTASQTRSTSLGDNGRSQPVVNVGSSARSNRVESKKGSLTSRRNREMRRAEKAKTAVEHRKKVHSCDPLVSASPSGQGIESALTRHENETSDVHRRLEVLDRNQDRIMESLTHFSHDFKNLRDSLQKEMAMMQQSLKSKAAQNESQNNSANISIDGMFPLTQDVPPAITYNPDALFSASITSEWKLLRLIQRTAPIASDLSHSSLGELLEVFCTFLTEKRFVSRVLPWLWQLTEPPSAHLSFTISIDLQRRLIDSLVTLRHDLPKETEQIEALLAVLQRRWYTHIHEETVEDSQSSGSCQEVMPENLSQLSVTDTEMKISDPSTTSLSSKPSRQLTSILG